MKKLILMLMLILGTFTFAEITEQERNSFFSPETQIYISNQKDWFYQETPEGDDGVWEKQNFFINILKVGKKYKISYTPIEITGNYDKEGYPNLVYKSQKNKKIPTTNSYGITLISYMGMFPGTEIKNGKKYERNSYQVLSESELNALLKSKNAKRLDSTTEKNTKLYLDWLFHNNN